MTEETQVAQEWTDAQNRAVKIALDGVFAAITKMEPLLVIPYLETLATFSIELLRAGGTKDDYVRGILDGAVKSLSQPPSFSMTDMRVN